MFQWIKSLFGSSSTRSKAKASSYGYDVARNSTDNARVWTYARGQSADALNSKEVRERLRNRARYEVANNSYARGIVNTLANDTIGTGPRLQVLLEDKNVARQIEREFTKWTNSIDLANKLHTMRATRVESGEAFLQMGTNPKIDNPVQLDVTLYEADQITSPWFTTLRGLNEEQLVDGMEHDSFGNVTTYHKLRHHPGDVFHGFQPEFDRVPSRWMVHWFKKDRPGQHRGIPEITPVLDLFVELRRYTLAVLAAAETAADYAAVLHTEAPPDVDEADEVDPFDPIEIERRAMMTVPAGWKMTQFKAEQPTTTYAEFKREILNEIARALGMPFNVAAGNSAGYNYASGRLDNQVYFKDIRNTQSDIEGRVLWPIFREWFLEAVLVGGVVPPMLRLPQDVPHRWFWDGREHVDPTKEASAADTRLRNFTTTLAHEYGRQGMDWEEQVRQIARERELLDELGLQLEQVGPQQTGEENVREEQETGSE